MAYQFFRPDEEADEWGAGYFVDESGQETYGFDPELARSLPVAPSHAAESNDAELRAGQDLRTAAWDSDEWVRRNIDPVGNPDPTAPQRPAAPAQMADVPSPPVGVPPAPAAAPAPAPAPAEGLSPFERQLAEAAVAAGLDPRAVSTLISGESGGKADAKNPRTSARGILQFTDATWQGLTERMGTPGVRREDLTAEEQIPYAIRYLKDAGLGPQSSPGEYKLAAISPGNVGAPDETVLFSTETDAGKKPNQQAYRLNTWADLNEDGQVTAGEVRAVGERATAKRAPGPAQLASGQGLAPMGPPGAPPAGMAQALPPGAAPPQAMPPGMAAPPGMQLGRLTEQSTTEDPAQAAARVGALEQAYGEQQMAVERAAKEQAAAMVQKAAQQGADAQERRRVALERQAHLQASQAATERDIDELVMRPIRQVDPTRVLRQMTFGRAVMLALGSFLGGGLSRGKFNPGEVIDKAIERDIQSQVEALRSGEANDRTRLAVWTRRLGSIEQGMAATRAELREAADQYLGAIQINRDAGTLLADRDQLRAELKTKQAQDIGRVQDLRLGHRTAQFVPTPRPTPVLPAPRVGERESPAVTDARVAQFEQLKPKDRLALLEPIKKDLGAVELAERGLQKLMRLYNVVDVGGRLFHVNDKGQRIPLLGEGGQGVVEIESDAIGPWWNVGDITLTDDAKSRVQQENMAWSDVEKGVLGEMAREPPNEFQARLLEVARPTRDANIGAALQGFYDIVREKRRVVEAMSDPNAWAYYQRRNPPPTPGRRPRPDERLTR